VQADDPDAVAGARVTVGHRDRDGFLQRQDVANLGVGAQRFEQRRFGRARQAEHRIDVICFERSEKGVRAGRLRVEHDVIL